jgi:hypothetical protein
VHVLHPPPPPPPHHTHTLLPPPPPPFTLYLNNQDERVLSIWTLSASLDNLHVLRTPAQSPGGECVVGNEHVTIGVQVDGMLGVMRADTNGSSGGGSVNSSGDGGSSGRNGSGGENGTGGGRGGGTSHGGGGGNAGALCVRP